MLPPHQSMLITMGFSKVAALMEPEREPCRDTVWPYAGMKERPSPNLLNWLLISLDLAKRNSCQTEVTEDLSPLENFEEAVEQPVEGGMVSTAGATMHL